MTETSASGPLRSGPARWVWFAGGWVAVGFGGVGVVVPGLPTTIFFIVAASCFARSSPRFEQWVLNLPGVGPMVRDYRSGLGMPRQAKVAATITMLVVAAISIAVLDHLLARAAVAAAIAVGIWYVLSRVPTRPAGPQVPR